MGAVIRTERGWAAHFCASQSCLFRRNTLLELGETRIIVSTVGDYRPRDTIGMDMIGAGRYYETLVAYAYDADGYWEMDPDREIEPRAASAICAKSIKDLPPLVSNVADRMHDRVVDEMIELLSVGEINESSA